MLSSCPEHKSFEFLQWYGVPISFTIIAYHPTLCLTLTLTVCYTGQEFILQTTITKGKQCARHSAKSLTYSNSSGLAKESLEYHLLLFRFTDEETEVQRD